MKRVSLLLSILAGLTVAGVLAAASSAADPPAVIPVGVTIGGVQVGRLTPDAALTAVQQSFDTPLELQLGSTRILVTPDVLGATPDVGKAIERALTAEPNSAVPLGVTVIPGAPAAFIATLAKRYDRPAVDAKLFLRHLRPWLSNERAGLKLDRRPAVRDVASAVATGVRTGITLTQSRVRPKVTRANFGPVIVIRRGSNRLYLYNGTHYQRLFAVATGQHQYPTPLGRFAIVVKWKNPWWYPPDSAWAQGQSPVPPGPGNPLGTRWMGLSAPGVGIHGTPSDGSIGYSVSHGCIRMHIPQAEWLFNHVEIGTTVFIVAS
ncbi:MAG: L,D-transpeptidase/peptidoglycan binding protein [Actinomycetota bacterium]|nr:L,D-transpeptidase/peptidoglycan binding protein [Actinomycetota bacterium]